MSVRLHRLHTATEGDPSALGLNAGYPDDILRDVAIPYSKLVEQAAGFERRLIDRFEQTVCTTFLFDTLGHARTFYSLFTDPENLLVVQMEVLRREKAQELGCVYTTTWLLKDEGGNTVKL